MTERQVGPEPPLAPPLLLASRWSDSRSLAEPETRGMPDAMPMCRLLCNAGTSESSPASR